MNDPVPTFVNDWQSDERKARWFKPFINGFVFDVANTMSIIEYHNTRLTSFHNQIFQVIEQTGLRDQLHNTTMAARNTLALDAEYQALILASRRCLDYSVRSFACFFQNDFHSFNKFSNFLNNHIHTVASELAKKHADFKQRFEGSLISVGTSKSTRDLLSHYNFVSAGCLNISQSGILIAGGGENLSPWENGKLLIDATQELVDLIRNWLRDSVDTIIDACCVHFDVANK